MLHFISISGTLLAKEVNAVQHTRILGIVLVILGFWVFMAPFIGPVLHLYLTPPPMHMTGTMHMGGVTSMNAITVVVNRAMVFFDFLPGVVLMFIGIYLAFSNQPSRNIL